MNTHAHTRAHPHTRTHTHLFLLVIRFCGQRNVSFCLNSSSLPCSNWHEPMNDLIRVAGWGSAVYFVLFFLIINLFLMDLLVVRSDTHANEPCRLWGSV